VENIYKLANNNSQIFSSSEILRKYINNDKQNNDIVMTESNTEDITDNIKQNLLKLKDNEYIIFKIPEENEISIGKSIIYNKYHIYNYDYIKIDYSLVKLYFQYAHFYMNILIEEVVLERIQNKTISPGLLSAMYAAAYMYKPNPDFQKSKKYAKLSYYSILKYCLVPNIQVIQAYIIISNCCNIK